MTAEHTPDLVADLRAMAELLGQRDGEWVEHHLVTPPDRPALDAAELMTEAANCLTETAAERDRLAKEVERLRKALKGSESLIQHAQGLITMFLVPDDTRVLTRQELVSKLIAHFDGPEQREVQSANRAALAKEQS